MEQTNEYYCPYERSKAIKEERDKQKQKRTEGLWLKLGLVSWVR